jgi:hypothetical protein
MHVEKSLLRRRPCFSTVDSTIFGSSFSIVNLLKNVQFEMHNEKLYYLQDQNVETFVNMVFQVLSWAEFSS